MWIYSLQHKPISQYLNNAQRGKITQYLLLSFHYEAPNESHPYFLHILVMPKIE
jgi:hypothetical protein